MRRKEETREREWEKRRRITEREMEKIERREREKWRRERNGEEREMEKRERRKRGKKKEKTFKESEMKYRPMVEWNGLCDVGVKQHSHGMESDLTMKASLSNIVCSSPFS